MPTLRVPDDDDGGGGDDDDDPVDKNLDAPEDRGETRECKWEVGQVGGLDGREIDCYISTGWNEVSFQDRNALLLYYSFRSLPTLPCLLFLRNICIYTCTSRHRFPTVRTQLSLPDAMKSGPGPPLYLSPHPQASACRRKRKDREAIYNLSSLRSTSKSARSKQDFTLYSSGGNGEKKNSREN